MANVRKRGNSYQIRVSCGYGTDNKQIFRSKTWKPKDGMTKKQIEKELERQKVLFEEQCKNGIVDSKVKFSDFVQQWKSEYAINHYKSTTMDTMTRALKRIEAELGHLRLDKITTRTIKDFIQRLSNGDNEHKPLGAKSVKNYVSFASSIFEYALYLEMISKNPCLGAKLPRIEKSEREMYTDDEAQLFIHTLIAKAPMIQQAYFILAIHSGFRRAELCGLMFSCVDFENEIITIDKGLYHVTGEGNILLEPKSRSSNRSLKLAPEVFDLLKRLQDYYEAEKKRLGSKWIDTDFVFKNPYGDCISPTEPNEWLHKFCEREKLKFVVPHSFRHLNASTMIDSGASVKTVQACLGHSDASTTLNIYAKAFARSQAIASQAVANKFKVS